MCFVLYGRKQIAHFELALKLLFIAVSNNSLRYITNIAQGNQMALAFQYALFSINTQACGIVGQQFLSEMMVSIVNPLHETCGSLLVEIDDDTFHAHTFKHFDVGEIVYH